MIKLKQFLGGLICALCGWMLTACSSDEDSLQIPEGKGYVKLNLTADAGFQTKAVDESFYENRENYTVQILDDEGSIVKNWKYTEIPEGLIELENGSYVLKAFCGEDENASTTSMYVEGTSDFDIDGDIVYDVVKNNLQDLLLAVDYFLEKMKPSLNRTEG